VSTTPVVQEAKFTAGVIDTAVLHLDLQISSRIFEKFEMILMLFSEAWRNMIHGKNLKQKIP
jgi:hypothetical protein